MKRKKTKKKQKASEDPKRINAHLLISFVLLILSLPIIDRACSADFGAGLSQSSTGTVGKNYNVGFGVTSKMSVSFYASDSTQKNSDSTVDNKSLAYKGTLIYKPDPTVRIGLGYKKIDDYNDYEGASYSGKVSIKNNSAKSSDNSFGTTKFSLGIQDDKMKYSKDEKETYERLGLSLGLSQVIGEYFTFGFDWSKNTFVPRGASTLSAFKNKAVSDTNISDTVESLSDSSVGGFIEYNDLSFYSLGVSYSQSKNYLDRSDTSNNLEAYADIDIWENITVSPAYAVTRSKSSSNPKVNSTSINISISY